MTDDLSVQQPKKGPAVITGTVLGAGAGYGATKLNNSVKKYVTDAKYSSYDDIIKESADEFKKSMEGEEASIAEKAQAFKNEVEQYKADLNAYIEANKEPKAPTELPADSPILKELEGANAELTAKKKELVDAEVKRLNAANEKAAADASVELPRSAQRRLAEYEEALKKETREWKKMQEAIGENELVGIAEKYMTAAETRDRKAVAQAEQEIQKFVERELKAPEGTEDIAAWRKNKVKEIKQCINDVLQERDLKAAANKRAKDEVKTLYQTRKEAFKTLGSDMSTTSLDEVIKNAERNIRLEDVRLNKLNKLSQLYKEYSEKAAAETGKSAKEITVQFERILGALLGDVKINISEAGEAPEVKSFVESLSKEELSAFKRLVGEEGDIGKNIQAAIEAATKRKDTLKKAITDIDTTGKRMLEIGKEKGMKFNQFGQLCYSDGAIVKLESNIPSFAEEPKLDFGESVKMKDLKRKIESIKAQGKKNAAPQLSAEEIAQKAETAVAENPELKAIKEKIAGLEAKKAEEIAKLPKPEPKTADQLKEIFEKEHGKESEIVEKYSKDIKKLWEGTPKGGKMAIVIGSGAALGLILGAIFAPKHKDA